MTTMLLAALQQVDKFYGEQTVLSGATLELRLGTRWALIGRNGSGKTTLLRLLLGLERPDAGQVFVREGVQLAMLEQDPEFVPTATVLEVAEAAFVELDALEQGLKQLEAEGLDRPDVFERWEALHEVFERRGGYERRARRDAVLYALGFRGREEQLAGKLSGGEKTRLGLAKLLMQQPDVLLLDEPTNHLDIDMREWLEGYLGRYGGTVVLVSHDRAFLDALATDTAEVSRGTLRTFDGTPSEYRAYRQEQLRIEEATRRNQAKELDRLSAMTEQMKAWAGQNAKLHRRAKAMAQRRDRFAEAMLDEAEPEERRVRFRFGCERSGELVLHAGKLTKRFGEMTLFEDVGFTVRRGERIALVGPNGAGKTSLLKMLLGDVPSDDPAAFLRFGSRVRVGYYDQELRGVDKERTLIDEMIAMLGDVEAHNMLGRFMFPYDAQYKRIGDLSGGERARLALLKLTLGEYNVLVLDEPTNHLDLEMIEALEAALGAYEGTLLLVSHDRRFIEATTDTIWALRDGRFTAYEGDWAYYQHKRRQLAAQREAKTQPARAAPQPAPEKRGPSKWQLERQLEALEAQIAALEGELRSLRSQLERPDGLEGLDIAALGERHAQVEGELLAAMAAWEEASELLEARR
jgi:ATP-binding cassette subfamily F protein 3